MVWDVDFKFKTSQERYQTGENIAGTVEIVVPESFNHLSQKIKLSFQCLGETKWLESHGDPSPDGTGYVSYDKYSYLTHDIPFNETDIYTKKGEANVKTLQIPFSYTIPKDEKLPSTMVSNHGFIQYFFQVEIQLEGEKKVFTREVIVRNPVDKHLMIAVIGSASKYVLLHNGSVTLQASIPRKGYAPGEIISVYLDIDNKCNISITPRLQLYQVQIYMCGKSHKTVETTFNEQPILGAEIAPHSSLEEVVQVKVPDDEALTISGKAISVKYFIHITLDIPNAFDLHVNLPVVMTTKEIIASLLEKEKASVKRVEQANVIKN